MTKTTYFISAHDMWMFRDSRPFNAQQNFIARSTFPPNPQVVYGFLRGQALELSDTSIRDFKNGTIDADLKKIIGNPKATEAKDTHGSLRLHSVHVGRMRGDNPDILYPVPNDLLVNKEDEKDFTISHPQQDDFITNAPFEGWQPLGIEDHSKTYESGWLDEANMQAYLNRGQVKSVIKPESLYMTDERIGLAINRSTRTAREHHLYHARFVRPHAMTPSIKDTDAKHDPEAITGLYITISGDDGALGDSGMISTGGEGRFAYYQRVNTAPLAPQSLGKVKIILQTPAYFSDGWRPKNGWGDLGQLVSFAISGAEHISGFDMVKKKPKPMRRLVPAGSVFYFDGVTNLPPAFTEDAGNAYPFAQMGFGNYIATTW